MRRRASRSRHGCRSTVCVLLSKVFPVEELHASSGSRDATASCDWPERAQDVKVAKGWVVRQGASGTLGGGGGSFDRLRAMPEAQR